MRTVLYDYWRSSTSYRVRIALALADVPYHQIPVDLTQNEQNSQLFLSRNPQGRVPVLEIDDQRFTQSLAILEYLNDTRSLNLLPSHPAKAANCRALAHSLAVDLHPVCNLSVLQHTATSPEDTQSWILHFTRPALEAFEAQLQRNGQTQYCCGDTLSLADLCLIPQLYNARRWHVDYSDLARMAAIEAACLKHPAFIAAHPDKHRPRLA